MKELQLLEMIGSVRDDYVMQAQKHRSDRVAVKKLPRRRALLIAALVVLMLLLAGCVAWALRLQDMKIGEHTYTQPRYIDEQGNKVYETEVTRDVISLQGIAGSPNYLAAQEWLKFTESYDPDYEILNKADPIDVPPDYDAYFVYTREMMDKVDEIARKYDLELAGELAGAEHWQHGIFLDAVGIDSLHKENPEVRVTVDNISFYACGNFTAEFTLTLQGDESPWPYGAMGTMVYHGKDYFNTVFSYMEDTENCEQWNYTVPDGPQVLIVLTGDMARILCDREDAFLSVSFRMEYAKEDGSKVTLTKQDVQRVADTFDFMVSPRKPDMEAVKKALEASFREYSAQQEISPKESLWGPDSSYADRIRWILENGNDPETYLYALRDITGDGVEELFLGRDGSFGTIRTLRDGKTTTLFSQGMDTGMYLCEGNIILSKEYFQEHWSYVFIRLEGDIYAVLEEVRYDPWEESWYVTRNGDESTKCFISEEKAEEIVASYPVVDLGMKPVSEYPLD